VNDPWTVSVADSLASQAVGKTVSWTGPAELFGLGSQSIEKTVTTSGPSLSGALPFYTGGVDRVFNFSYSIQDGPSNCPVRLTQKSAIAEGHGGLKCSLSPALSGTGNGVFDWLAILGFSVVPLLYSRMRIQRK
jgi:hypothetical protein